MVLPTTIDGASTVAPRIRGRRSDRTRFLEQFAVLQAQLPPGDRRRFGIVRHHQQRHVQLLIQPLQQPQNLHRRVIVQVSRRLVGHDDLGVRHDRPGDADALLLAAGKLPRVMLGPVRQVHGLQGDLGPLLPLGPRHRQQAAAAARHFHRPSARG